MMFKEQKQHFQMLRRRKWQIILTALAVFVVTAAVAFLLPPLYESKATILIEEPDVPSDLVKSTISSYVDQRIQMINQRVMTTANLIGLIRKYNLYAGDWNTHPLTELAERLRKDIHMDLISADIVDPANGRTSKATIAFSLAYEDEKPIVAQNVVNDVVSLYLNENLRDRRERATQTTTFLASEADKLSRHVLQLEAAMADFKARYAGSLPDDLTVTMQSVDRTQRDLLDVQRRMEDLQQQRTFLQSELASTDPYGGPTSSGQAATSPQEQLRISQTDLARLRALYGNNHPDVVKLKRQVEGLKAAVGGGNDRAALEEQYRQLKQQHAVLRKKYSDAHPDVVALNRQIAEVKKELDQTKDTDSSDKAQQPTNPNYVRLQTQLESVNSELSALQKQSAAIRETLAKYESAAARAPQVEKDYQVLARDHDASLTQLQDIRSKQTEAQLAENVEVERKGERFTIIEPPSLPQLPSKPNRPAILLLGLVFGLAAGIGMGFLAERLDDRIYGARQLGAVLGAPPLIAVPIIRTEADIKRTRTRWTAASAVVVGGSVAALILIHLFVMPLDVLWAVAERRLAVM